MKETPTICTRCHGVGTPLEPCGRPCVHALIVCVCGEKINSWAKFAAHVAFQHRQSEKDMNALLEHFSTWLAPPSTDPIGEHLL